MFIIGILALLIIQFFYERLTAPHDVYPDTMEFPMRNDIQRYEAYPTTTPPTYETI